jgi:hypothetical protein
VSQENVERVRRAYEFVLVLVHFGGRGKRSGLDLVHMRTTGAGLLHVLSTTPGQGLEPQIRHPECRVLPITPSRNEGPRIVNAWAWRMGRTGCATRLPSRRAFGRRLRARPAARLARSRR